MAALHAWMKEAAETTLPNPNAMTLATIDPDSEPVLAHEALAMAAYEARLRDFRDAKRWHPFERVTAPRR